MSRNVPIWRRLLEGWKQIAMRFGYVQTLLILVFFYGILIGPTALGIIAGRRDYLGKRGLWRSGSAWNDADSATPDLERAGKRF